MSASSSPTPTDPNNAVASSLLPDGSAWIPPSSGGSSFWSSAGGPALVVILVAIGLLSIMIALLLLVRHRHIRFLDDDDFDFGPLNVNLLRKKQKLGPKPQIFELPYAYEKYDHSKENVAQWTGIVPISATFFAEKPDRPAVHDSEKTPMSSPTSSNASPTCQTPSPIQPPALAYPSADPAAPGPFSWRTLRRSPSRDTSLEPESALVPDTMQVAVAIAMPCPSTPASRRSSLASASTGGSAVRAPVPELCLGFAQVPGVAEERWRELHAAAAQTEKEEV
ncbi:hypothetical protein PsYK624_012650 [Phanerochaete sordida]|uniref:Uncharacterized protein n=1 Tax=Phanerochaete sordida TaxID=48140 RepID=A0A9P3FZ50_9APHY|nr:hypothetical protein PsYK624_012650 [Phanerochaete sordida]